MVELQTTILTVLCTTGNIITIDSVPGYILYTSTIQSNPQILT